MTSERAFRHCEERERRSNPVALEKINDEIASLAKTPKSFFNSLLILTPINRMSCLTQSRKEHKGNLGSWSNSLELYFL